MKTTAVDLFSGGGGLTLGMMRAGFDVVAAVEVDKSACATYEANHQDVSALQADIRTLDQQDVVGRVDGRKIDLLAGCPPCQGFTSLSARYKRDDPRNQLVLELARLAEELRPRAIMLENVPGLAGTQIYRELWRRLHAGGYHLSDQVLQVADYGVPQSRRRLVLLGGHGFEIAMPQPTHSRKAGSGTAHWRTVRDAIGHMPGNPPTLVDARSNGGVQGANWHVVRSLSRANVARIRAAQPGRTWPHLPEQLRPKCHRGDYTGYTNVYGRMEWDRPSPTITGGCTTLSKGRFGHPEEDRTISVREAALLQTFPEDYVFDTPYMEHVCNIIGNALPCDFAEVVARQCYEALDRCHGGSVEA